ncbi:Cytochrome P450 [Canna indica]|uniref:Cytochrome P450 n=1 Tax=Canna indica TaxID=4628 RepID=A0AAQ3QRJ3_9LILI|nr:Cytochrome P450 [Canna indica]
MSHALTLHAAFSIFPLILLLSLSLVAVLVFIYLAKKKPPRCRLPPAPPRLPVIGNLHQLGALPHRSLHRLSLSYGPLMLLKLGHIPTLVVSSPDHARDVLKTHDISFCSRPRLTAGHKLSYGGLDIAFAPFSDHWIRMRKLSSVEFFSAKRVQLLLPTREEEVRTLVQNISRTASANVAVNLSEMFLCLLSNVTSRALFGKRSAPVGECVRSEFDGMISRSIELMGGFVAGDFFPCMQYLLNVVTGVKWKLERNFKEIDEFLERDLEEKEERIGGDEEDGSDMASILVKLHKDESSGLTRDEIKAMLMVLFIAGADTSSAVLVWTMTELMRNPSVLAKARDEVRSIAKEKDYVEESDLHHLVYLNMVLKEALRLHTPGPLLLPREAREDCQIGGYEIPAGTRVYINAWAIGRDTNTWDCPEDFRPQRFEKSSIDYKGQHFEFIPFGGGRRICPGIAMAVATIELTLANLLLKFDWSLPDGMSKENIDMSESFGIVVHKKVPLVLVAKPVN